MLDYPSSRARNWAGTGILFLFFAALVVVNTFEEQVYGDLTFRAGTIRLSGTNRHPELVFEAVDGSVVCKVARCRYPNWRNDIGAKADIGVDERGQVSQIVVMGMTRLSVDDFDTRYRRGIWGCALLLTIGVAMCFRAWREIKKS